MHDTIELTIQSRYEYIEFVGSITKSVTDLLEFDDDTANWIELAVRESVINAIKHGNRLAADKSVALKFTLEPAALTVHVRDLGEGFDLSQIPDPLDPENLLNPSGRGIFYMKTFMDEVDYTRHPEGGTVVRMVKRRSVPADKGDSESDGSSDN